MRRLAFLIYLCVAAWLFRDALLSLGAVLPSAQGTDVAAQFLAFREYGFSELRHGRLALWNPYLFSGLPFFGGFESALLYPLNWIHLFLPAGLGVAVTVVLHITLGAFFTFLWCRSRKQGFAASLTAGFVYVLCGPFFLKIYAGHLPPLCVMAWAPLLMLALERGELLGAAAIVALQVFAGNPQNAYYTAIAAAIFTLCAMPRRLPALAAVYLGGAALAAVQLLPGVETARESVRTGITYAFSASFSLPPENLLTLIAPDALGSLGGYFGRWYFWEACAFFGVVALALACIGARRVKPAHVVVPCVLLLLAISAYTPLFGLLYRFVPGFSSMRGTAKFASLAVLFAAPLVGEGIDAVASSASLLRGALCAAAAGAVALLGAFFPQQALLEVIARSGESYVRAPAGAHVALWEGAAFLLVAAGIFTLRSIGPLRGAAIATLAIFELLRFAAGSGGSAPADFPYPDAYRATRPEGDERVLHEWERWPNEGLRLREPDVWGYSALVSRRYAQLMAVGQGEDPAHATQYLTFRHDSPVLDLVRCRYVFLEKRRIDRGRDKLLPHALLVHRYRISSDARLLAAKDFDPRAEVLLEEEPSPRPEPATAPESVTVTEATPERLEIDAQLSAPGLLLVTDPYSGGWRAGDLRVLAADHALRAVALGKGTHHVTMTFLPRTLPPGAALTLATLLLGAWVCARRIRRARARAA